MKSTSKASMVYRKGLINGASKEYRPSKGSNKDVNAEINSLILAAGIGLFLIISGLLFLRVLG